MHIGSGPGLSGLSGMQGNPGPLHVSCRSVRILSSAPMATIVAPSAMDFGAACMALATMAASPDG